MITFTITFWTGNVGTVTADSLSAVFADNFGGEVTATGYNSSGARMVISDDGTYGIVLNDMGDECATIRVAMPTAVVDAAREINAASFRNEYGDARMINATASDNGLDVETMARIDIAYALAEAGYDMTKIRRRFA